MTQPPPAPREFAFSAAPFGVRFLLLFGGIWSLVGALVTTVFCLVSEPVWVDWALDSRGVTVEAKATEVRPTSASVNRRPVYEITARDGDKTFTVSSAERSTIERARRGDALSVTYDPQAPNHARVDGERASLLGPFIAIPLFFLLAGLVMVATGWTQLRRVRSVFVSGEASMAKVLSVERTSMKMNGRMMYRAKYEFRAGAQSTTGSYLTPNPPETQAELWVLYLANDPSTSTPYNPGS